MAGLRWTEQKIRKMQVVQRSNREGSNLGSHIGQSICSEKRDKFYGGILTGLLVIILLLPSMFINMQNYYKDANPKISSIAFKKDSMNVEAETVRLDQVNKMYFYLHDFNYRSYSTRDMEPYMKLVLRNYHVKYLEDGSKDEHTLEFDDVFRDCRTEDFNENELNFFQYYQFKNRSLICYDQTRADIYLQGTRAELINKMDHSYMVLRVLPCSNDTLTDAQKARGFTCASSQEISKWRRDMNLKPLSIQY